VFMASAASRSRFSSSREIRRSRLRLGVQPNAEAVERRLVDERRRLRA